VETLAAARVPLPSSFFLDVTGACAREKIGALAAAVFLLSRRARGGGRGFAPPFSRQGAGLVSLRDGRSREDSRAVAPQQEVGGASCLGVVPVVAAGCYSQVAAEVAAGGGGDLEGRGSGALGGALDMAVAGESLPPLPHGLVR
jgi:hypothetical protein